MIFKPFHEISCFRCRSTLHYDCFRIIIGITGKLIRDIYLEIEKRYEMHFVEIETNKCHVHFLVQSFPISLVRRIVTIIKSMTTWQVLDKIPELEKELWGASLWTSGCNGIDIKLANSYYKRVPNYNKMNLPTIKCLRCGYEWVPRQPTKPRKCAKCNSFLWNKPKVK